MELDIQCIFSAHTAHPSPSTDHRPRNLNRYTQTLSAQLGRCTGCVGAQTNSIRFRSIGIHEFSRIEIFRTKIELFTQMRLPNEFQCETASKNEKIHWPKCAFDRNHSVEYFLSSINADDDSHWFIFGHLFVGIGSMVTCYSYLPCKRSLQLQLSFEREHASDVPWALLFILYFVVSQSIPSTFAHDILLHLMRSVNGRVFTVYIYLFICYYFGLYIDHIGSHQPAAHWKHDKFLTVNKLWDRLWRRHHLLFVAQIADWPIRSTLLLTWQQLEPKNHWSQLWDVTYFVIHAIVSLTQYVIPWKSEVVCCRNGALVYAGTS